jgi:hypothetical protein
VEIKEVIEDLERRGVLTVTENRVTSFSREKAQRLIDAQVMTS